MSADPMPNPTDTPLPDGLVIEPMTEALLDQVHAIERESFPDPWPRRFFEEEISRSDPAYARVVLGGDRVIGYLVAWFVLDEVHLGNLAVHPEHRRQGVGRLLVQHLVERAERRGASFISLEVRAGNRAAMSLYARHHFRPEGVRKGYYAGREDAVIMVRECGREAAAPTAPPAAGPAVAGPTAGAPPAGAPPAGAPPAVAPPSGPGRQDSRDGSREP